MTKQSPNAKVLVLAGIGPGFGEALATVFARAGYRVAGIARSGEWGRNFEREMLETGGHYRHYMCDLTNEWAVGATLAEIESDLGAVEALVYNAMALTAKPFIELSAGEFEESWRTGCLGAMLVASALAPGFLARKRGTMIFTGATASIRGGARFAAFASAKFALRGFTQALAREYGREGIHVVHTVLDGLIWGPQTNARFPDARRADCLAPEAIAKQYLQLVEQDRSAWTHELDLRPFGESF